MSDSHEKRCFGFMADLHGKVPDVSSWPHIKHLFLLGDLLVNDRSQQLKYYHSTFLPWMKYLIDVDVVENIYYGGGNHDHLFFDGTLLYQDDVIRFVNKDILELDGTNVAVYMPTVKNNPHPSWANSVTSEQQEHQLRAMFEGQQFDFVGTHEGPKHILDYDIKGYGVAPGELNKFEHFGSTRMRKLLDEGVINTKYWMFGHIHGQGGNAFVYSRNYEDIPGTTFRNVANRLICPH